VSSLDPKGKRALFEAPVAAAPDTLGTGAHRQGTDALYSSGPRQVGTVVVECATCIVRTRVSLVDLGARLATLSVWLPARRHGHWMRCPACRRRTWCRVDWNS
jgi:hypothetical protein